MKPIPASERCHVCGTRWAQSRDRLCRRCQRELGDTSTTFEREQARLARTPRPRRVPAYEPDRSRTVTIGHREYWVMWDGSMDGAIARGLALEAHSE